MSSINRMSTSRHSLATLFVVWFACTQEAFAATTLGSPAPGVGLTLQDFVAFLITIIQAVIMPALVIAIIYAGFTLVTANGNEEQITKGKIWIMWTLVGAAIVLAAQVIANYVFNTAALF